MKKGFFQLSVVFLTGLLGGLTAQWLFPVPQAFAASRALQAEQFWIHTPEGKYRLQMGTYTNPGEQGLPLLGLSDNSDHLRLLLRLAGPNGSPVLVFKDKNGTDRMVIGLTYSGGDEIPFITYTNAAGNSRSLLN